MLSSPLSSPPFFLQIFFYFVTYASHVVAETSSQEFQFPLQLTANDQTIQTAQQNSLNFVNSLLSLNNSGASLVISPGIFYMAGPIVIDSLMNVKIQWRQGASLIFLDNFQNYTWTNNAYPDMIAFTNSHYLSFIGSGMDETASIDGQGFAWWEQSILFALHKSSLKNDNRPKLLSFSASTNLEFTSLHLKNSPCFHLKLSQVMNVTIDNLTVEVDIESQKSLKLSLGNLGNFIGNSIPMFPLNTDGVDIGGGNVTIRNYSYTGYDDAVAIKPANIHSMYTQCTRDILVDGATVAFSAGMSVGSVPTSVQRDCVNNITFRNVVMNHPIKAIYIKSNPGDVGGSGSISNILYENFQVFKSLWWPIYIGPQQMLQPNGAGTGLGCFTYPLGSCQTNADMKMSNITLRNIVIKDTVWPYAGLIRANQSSPIVNLTFDNVQVSGGLSLIDGWKCENVIGSSSSNTSPRYGICF